MVNEALEVDLDELDQCMLGVEEPSDFHEASKEFAWRKAMQEEMISIESNVTWKLADLPL